MSRDRQEQERLKAEYKQRAIPMGILALRHRATGRAVLEATQNLDALGNRIRFQFNLGQYPDPAFQAAWVAEGPEAFAFEVAARLEAREGATPRDYRADLETLLELCQEAEARR